MRGAVLQFAANPLGTPQSVVACHVVDEPERLGWDLRVAWPRVRFPLPEQAKSLSMPVQHRLGIDDQQGVLRPGGTRS